MVHKLLVRSVLSMSMMCSALVLGVRPLAAAEQGAVVSPRVALSQDLPPMEPLALAYGDFNGDGYADLVVGGHALSQDAVTIYQGNPKFESYPKDSTFGTPFLGALVRREIGFRPEILSVGDFDANGTLDVVVTHSGAREFSILKGDGHGKLSAPEAISLPGAVTALVVGDVNRADGLKDIVVAVHGQSGSQLLVFEGLFGAAVARPESIQFDGAIDALAVGYLDDDIFADIAVASDRTVFTIHGRDRQLARGGDSLVPRIDHLQAASPVKSMTAARSSHEIRQALLAMLENGSVVRMIDHRIAEVGHAPSQGAQLVVANFSGVPQRDVLVVNRGQASMNLVTAGSVLDVSDPIGAVVPIRLGTQALNRLLVVSAAGDSVRLVGPLPASTLAAFVVNSLLDTSDAAAGDGLCDDGAGNCTLRAAIQETNALAGADSITFSIGAGAVTISPASALPAITGAVTMDATTQTGYAGTPLIRVDGASAGATSDGLIVSGLASTIKGLVITGFKQNGLILQGASGGTVVTNSYFGLDVDGLTAVPNTLAGIRITSSTNTIGGLAAGDKCVMSANGTNGVLIAGGDSNTVVNNNIGVSLLGTTDKGNTSHGVFLTNGSVGNTIGALTSTGRNIISGNDGDGVQITGLLSSGNLIERNYIGTDSTGLAALGNTGNGVQINNAVASTVGGPSTATNVISGNGVSGVRIVGTAASVNIVESNFIGTNDGGTAALANALHGVAISNAPSNTIGAPGIPNLISGNTVQGVDVTGSGATANEIQGNGIGCDNSGLIAIGNGGTGVAISGAAKTNKVGGGTVGAGNLISANALGVSILQANTLNNVIQGNSIGVGAGGGALGNTGDGVRIDRAGVVGGSTGGGLGNTIRFNGGNGVTVPGATTTGATIEKNDISDNTGLGIDLGNNGVTANDAGDGDTGANNLQNFPVLDVAVLRVNTNVVQGKLNSLPSRTYRLEFFACDSCDASGFGEGQSFRYTSNVSTDITGNVSFSIKLGGTATPVGKKMTATATDLTDGSTSEFSACTTVIAAPTVQFSSATQSVGEAGPVATITVTRTGSTVPYGTVDYHTKDGTAKAGLDYTAASGTLTFASGDTSKTFDISITDDLLVEPSETVIVKLGPVNLEGIVLGTPSTLTLTILDND